MAACRSVLASSMVSPWPFAPGISTQIAQKPPSGAGSITAVSSPFIKPAPVTHSYQFRCNKKWQQHGGDQALSPDASPPPQTANPIPCIHPAGIGRSSRQRIAIGRSPWWLS